MMHYALVSDLITEEEFDRLVEEKSQQHEGILDEVASAMLVVADLGRSHIKIAEIPKSQAKIVSFFGKILSIDGPREFNREGEDEPGAVASLVLGDPTGVTKMTLWDERAGAVNELSIGQVIEVIGRPIPEKKEVGFVALRESNVEIVETKKPPKSELMDKPLIVKILIMFPVRNIEKKDGSVSCLQEMLVGDESGTARLTTWAPDTFSDTDEGASVSINGVTRKEDDGIIEYVALDTAVVTPHPTDIPVLRINPGDVEEGQTPVVVGKVAQVYEIHTFINRKKMESKVRNLRITGNDNSSIGVVLWGEYASMMFLPGDNVEIINALAQQSRAGGLELSVGFGAVIRIDLDNAEPIEIDGTILLRPAGFTLETEKEVWLLTGDISFEPGMSVHISGMATNGRILVTSSYPRIPDCKIH